MPQQPLGIAKAEPLGIAKAEPFAPDDAVSRAASKATGIRGVTTAEKMLAWLPTAGGVVGGLIGTAGGGPATGVGGAALGGAGGEAWRQNLLRLINWFSSSDSQVPVPQTPTDAAAKVGTEGMVQGGAELVGHGLAAAARGIARPMMENAIRPSISLQQQFPTIVETALKERIPVGRVIPGAMKGSERAARKRAASAATTNGILRNADASGVTIPMDALTAPIDALRADVAMEAGLSDAEVSAVDAMMQRFVLKHGNELSPLAVKELKQTAQSIAKPIYNAQAKGLPVTAADGLRGRFNQAVATGAKDALEQIPGGIGDKVAASEGRTQSLIGVQRAVRQAEMRRLPLWSELGSTAAGATAGQMFSGDPKTGAEAGLSVALLVRALTSPRSLSRGALLATWPAMQQVLRQVPRASIAAYLTALGDTQQEQPR